MPHEFVVGAFEPGDDDLGDFMLDIWLAFARDDCNWVDNRAPAVGTRPEVEVWTHRGSIGTPTAPFFFAHTKATHMQIFTGNGIDTGGQEIYDQPGNPGNAPVNTSFSDTSNPDMRCLFLNSLVGPYEGYWLFADTTGEYIHCVIKVSSREYRHFHVGLLRQVDGGTDLDPESFYITSHFWGRLAPDVFIWDTLGGTNDEHSPYMAGHRVPFRTHAGTSPNGAFSRAQLGTIPCAHYYMPGLNPIALVSAAVNNGGSGHAVNDIITLSLNDGTGTAPTLRVTAESAGVITAVSVEDAGGLTNRIYPNTAVTQASTTGTGINATFDLTQEGHSWYMAQRHDGLECLGSPVDKSEGNPGTAVGDVNEVVHIGCAQTNYYDAGLGTTLFCCDRNFTANANALVPIYVSAAFDFQSDIRQGVVATIPDVFRVNMRDYTPEQTITVGGEDYKVFPVINMDSVNVTTGEGYSGWEGLAYRVETGAVT